MLLFIQLTLPMMLSISKMVLVNQKTIGTGSVKKEKRACFADRSSAVNGKGCQELQIKASKCALTVNINLFREELSWRRAG